MPKKIYIFGYIILFFIIVLFFLCYFKDKTIYIEAGPKGGFFSYTANYLKKSLKKYNIKTQINYAGDTTNIIKIKKHCTKYKSLGHFKQNSKNIY